MRVALDGRTLQSQPPGGVGRSLAALVGGLSAQLDLDVLLDARLPDPTPESLGDADGNQSGRGTPTWHRLRAPVGGGASWLQWAVPRWLREHAVDLFHCPFYGLPYRQPVPMVVTIYDLSFQSNPEWFSARQRAVFSAQAAHAARTARVVFTGSAHVAEDIEAHLGVGPRRVRVAPPQPSPGFVHAVESRSAGSSPPESDHWPYLVTLGGAPRRRLAVAVAAWQEARRQGSQLDLVVVGTEAPPTQSEGLRWAGAVSDQEWARWLGGAVAFVYSTAYEGFGLPALEAALAGTPVIAAPVGAMREVLGEAAAWVPRPAARPLAEAIRAMEDDADERARLAVGGRERARYWMERAESPTGALATTLAGYAAAVATR